jgi:hypothetical protein
MLLQKKEKVKFNLFFLGTPLRKIDAVVCLQLSAGLFVPVLEGAAYDGPGTLDSYRFNLRAGLSQLNIGAGNFKYLWLGFRGASGVPFCRSGRETRAFITIY